MMYPTILTVAFPVQYRRNIYIIRAHLFQLCKISVPVYRGGAHVQDKYPRFPSYVTHSLDGAIIIIIYHSLKFRNLMLNCKVFLEE